MASVAACSTGQPGTSVPSEAPAPTNSANGGSGLAQLDACQVFDAQATSQLGLEGAGEVKNFAGGRGCDWDTAGGGIRVVLYDSTSLEKQNLSDGQVESTTFAGREAKIQREALGAGDCSLLFAVGDSSSVSLDATSNDMNTDASCQLAQQAGELVVAKLPKN
ncbi:DUF3558 domain-containing protein [Saccharopolyspora antimicrobica]|nr:DUF3558 domain-containing protein [Saccharopolyspora antimicrobica]